MQKLSEEAIQLLRELSRPGRRLHGRFDREVSFLRTDPTNTGLDPKRCAVVPLTVAEELFEAGFIRIDERAPLRDTYTFQMSTEGEAYLAKEEAAEHRSLR